MPPNTDQRRQKQPSTRVFDDFLESYVAQTLEDIAGADKKTCAARALCLLLNNHRKNFEGCFYGLWNAMDKSPDVYRAKARRDVVNNIQYVQNNAPDGCSGHFLKQFGQSLFETMEQTMLTQYRNKNK